MNSYVNNVVKNFCCVTQYYTTQHNTTTTSVSVTVKTVCTSQKQKKPLHAVVTDSLELNLAGYITESIIIKTCASHYKS